MKSTFFMKKASKMFTNIPQKSFWKVGLTVRISLNPRKKNQLMLLSQEQLETLPTPLHSELQVVSY